MVTSSAVVGSSASSRPGELARAIAIIDPLAHAAGELVRVVAEARARRPGCRPGPAARRRARVRRPAAQAGMRLQVLADLAADREHRVERGHRLLEDHRDLAARATAAARARPSPPARDRARSPSPRRARVAVPGPGSNAAPRSCPSRIRRRGPGPRPAAPRGRCRRPPSACRAAWRSWSEGLGSRASCSAVTGAGRSRSARPSPSRLKPSPVTTMATPGNTEIHQAVVMKFLPSAISTPHSAAGGWAPRPR